MPRYSQNNPFDEFGIDIGKKKRLRGDSGKDIEPLPKKPAKANNELVPREVFPDVNGNMADAPGETSAAASIMGMSSVQGNLGAHETPVIPHAPSLGFNETHTTIIPTTIYLSANKLATGASAINKLEIRMNSPYNPIITPSSLVAQTAGAAIAEGLSIVPAPNDAVQPTPLLAFPSVYTTSHKPMWLKWWEQVYQAYTVIETQYEITIANARTTTELRPVIYWENDTYGASSTGNIMPSGTLDEMSNWGVQKRILAPLDADGAREGDSCTVIKGTWKPNTLTRNVVNDGDYKTWNDVGAVPSPTYVESLHLRFFNGPLTNINAYGGVNIQIKLKYVVQFKDLVTVFRYPVTGGTAVDLIAPTDILKTA